MTGKHPLPVGSRTVVDDLRDDLSLCERWVVQISAGAPTVLSRAADKTSDARKTDGLALLRLLDDISDELERLKERGVDLRSERGRFEDILSQLRRRDKALVARVGAEMTTQRPVDARWWWYLNEQVAAARGRQVRRIISVALVGVGVLALLYLLYNRFLAPPLNVRQAHSHVFEGERAVFEGDLEGAVEQFEEAIALDPEQADAQLWLGVLYQSLGNTDQAADAFGKARKVFATEAEFLFQRGILYLSMNDVDAAKNDALAVIELAADQPQGYFLLGSVAEQIGDLELARDAFERTAQLAEETDQLALQVTARVRLAYVLQRFALPPQQ